MYKEPMIKFRMKRTVGTKQATYFEGREYEADHIPCSEDYLEIVGEYNPIPTEQVQFRKRRPNPTKAKK